MTKAELVEEVARAAELNKRDAEVIVETVFESIIGALHKGEKVELRGFGSFRTRERGPRRGRNPKTGEPVDVPAKRVPYFKPGKELKEYFTESPEGDGGKQDGGAEGKGGAAASSEQAPFGASLASGSPDAGTGDEAAGGIVGSGEVSTPQSDPASVSTSSTGQGASSESSEQDEGRGGEGSTGGSSGY